MAIILVIVVAIKCIPKDKLPYCLGGTKELEETFISPSKYEKWCRKNRLKVIYDRKRLHMMPAKKIREVAIETLKANRRPITGVALTF